MTKTSLSAILFLAFTLPAWAQQSPKLDLRKGDRIVFLGDTFADRAAQWGYIETMFHTRLPELQLTFRNLAYPADTVAVHIADLKDGTTDSNRGSNRALNFGTMPKHLTDAQADVIFLCFGMADSFAGEAGLADFTRNLQFLIKEHQGKQYNGKTSPRLALVGPIAHEKLGGRFPDPTEHNKDLALYTEAMRKVAAQNKLPFVDLFTPTAELMRKGDGDRLTINGIHLSQYGNWAAAHLLAEGFGLPASEWSRVQEGTIKAKQLPFPAPPSGSKVHAALQKRVAQFVNARAFALEKPPQDYVLVINGEACESKPPQKWIRSFPSEFTPITHTPMNHAAEHLRLAVVDQNQQWFYRWRAVNGEYVYGRRAKPFGVVNFPGEMAKLDQMCRELDKTIHTLSQPEAKYDVKLVRADQAKQYKPLAPIVAAKASPSVEEVFKQKQGLIGGKTFTTAADLEAARKSFKLPEGYEVNLFASEKDFPLHDPVSMAWDTRGRLWVTCMPTYPHQIPGVPPNDKIIILEDTDGDGRADKHTVFADGLYLPTGIEFGDGGVYIGAQPNVMFLKDTNGDDVADVRENVLHGFGTGDSHHAVHAFVRTPEGALLIHEGIFHRSNVETPWGVVRQRDAGIYRFDPRSHKLETYVSYNFANPWGHVFDRWGYNFIADASGGANYNGLPLTGKIEFPRQHPGMKVFTTVVRPTCGCELISSRQFPPEVQGDFLVNNNIGFQGIKHHRPFEEGSGFASKEQPPLLQSSDVNFRPVAIKHGPDGALYIVDWFNPLVGHMQFSLRDPNRDHYHGRIWRITAKGRPLVKMPKIHGEPIAKVLEALKEPENLTRYLARAELRERPAKDVAAALKTWIGSLKEDDPEHEHLLLEALWVYEGINEAPEDLLARLLHAKDHRARGAATRALRNELHRFPLDKSLAWLEGQANDVHPRVRLEAVVACSFVPDGRAADVALQSLKHPTDYYLDYGLKETMTTLEPYWKPHLAAGKPFAVGNPAGANYLLGSVSTQELVKMPRTEPVLVAMLTRDGVQSIHRQEALDALARLHKTDAVTELINAIERLDKGDMHGGKQPTALHGLHDLGHLLAAARAEELSPKRPRIEKLALTGKEAMTRQMAFAALVASDRGIAAAWKSASTSAPVLTDLVEAIPYVVENKLRQEAYPLVKELMLGTSKVAKGDAKTLARLRVAAFHAAATIPGHEEEVFKTLSMFFGEGVERSAAVKAIRSLPRDKVPQKEIKPLVFTIIGYVSKTPPKQRTEIDVLDALQLGNELAALLPAAEAKEMRAQLGELGVQVIVVRTVPHLIAYDRTKIYVEAGKPAVIVFDNNDIMPHNLVISQPGSLAEIGLASEMFGTNPNAAAQGYLPKNKKILYATRMLSPREADRIQFVAPTKPGQYVYVCTFPGHWRVMNGILHVVPKLSDVPPSELNPPTPTVVATRPFVRNWTLEELTPELIHMERGRSLDKGKELFKAASCIQCHKMQGEGGNLGPDLAETAKKVASLKLNKIGLLTEILDPSKNMEDKYRPWTFLTSKGDVVSGLVLHEDKKTIRVQGSPQEKPREIRADDVEEKTPSRISIMPNGLLVTLSKEEVLDLLAYIVSAGDPRHPVYSRKE